MNGNLEAWPAYVVRFPVHTANTHPQRPMYYLYSVYKNNLLTFPCSTLNYWSFISHRPWWQANRTLTLDNWGEFNERAPRKDLGRVEGNQEGYGKGVRLLGLPALEGPRSWEQTAKPRKQDCLALACSCRPGRGGLWGYILPSLPPNPEPCQCLLAEVTTQESQLLLPGPRAKWRKMENRFGWD